MEVRVLFAERKGRYPGQYGIEALAVMSEADFEDNPDYLPDTLRQNQDTGEFESLAIVTLSVDEAAIRRILKPEVAAIAAEVVGAHNPQEG